MQDAPLKYLSLKSTMQSPLYIVKQEDTLSDTSASHQSPDWTLLPPATIPTSKDVIG